MKRTRINAKSSKSPLKRPNVNTSNSRFNIYAMIDALEEIGLQSSDKEKIIGRINSRECTKGVDKVKTVKTLVTIGLMGIL